MNEKELYSRILSRLYNGLKTDNYSKFQNNRLEERRFSVNNLYPDVILTRKETKEIEFIVEIVLKSDLKKEQLQEKWKPLSESAPVFYLLVPKTDRNMIETWCNEEKMRFRIGTYELNSGNIDIKFF